MTCFPNRNSRFLAGCMQETRKRFSKNVPVCGIVPGDQVHFVRSALLIVSATMHLDRGQDSLRLSRFTDLQAVWHCHTE